jgi:hypothetical protein
MMLTARWLPALVVLFTVVACAPEAPGARPRHFTSTDVATRDDALSSGVVISQLYTAGGNSGAVLNRDFVELFNRGTSAVNVSGWSVQYASDTATGAWSVTPLGDAGVLAPGQYLLVGGASGGTGSAIPTPEVSGTTNFSATAGKVALVASATALTGCPAPSAVVDLVGYGSSANCSETAAVTPGPSATNAIARAVAGCTETDNNDADFATASPSPRNKNAALNVCGPSDAGTPSCTVFNTWPTAISGAGYSVNADTTFANFFTQIPAMSDGGMDWLVVEAYYGNTTLTVPTTVTYTSSSDYTTCDICPLIRRGCSPTGACSQRYFAQAGTAVVSVATPNAQAGQFIGSLSNMRFVEWDFSTDRPKANGQCIELASLPFNLSWDAGTPADAGTGTGGGGGSATGGGGGSATGGGAGTGGGSAVGGGGGGDPVGGGAGGGSGGGAGGGGGRDVGPRPDGGATGGGAGGGGGASADDAGTMGGGSGGGSTTATGGGFAPLGGGLGGGGGGGGTKGGGCGCSSEEQLFAPLAMLALTMLGARRRRS